MDDKRAKDEAQARDRATLLGVRYFDTSQLVNPPLFQDVLSNEEMYQKNVVILTRHDGSMIIGITSKTPQSTISEMTKRFQDERINFVLISEAGFKDFMRLYDPPEEIVYEDVKITDDSQSNTLTEVSQTIDKILAPDMFEYLVKQATRLEASDIHLETQQSGDVKIRFRVHGVLHNIANMKMEKSRQLMAQLAARANISSSSPKPQTGHITHQLEDQEVNIRIETMASLYGQDAVLRVFTVDADLLQLAHLGIHLDELELVNEIIEHPTGLVVAVGPTGSGKTTTLYSIINQLNKPSRKIITLEDPVEYSIDGLIQIPINTNKEESFADGLRSALRMDPDVLMIGEIRDADTANTALQAALSGHLVLSTFHASDAAAALTRLLAFTGGNPLFTSALRLVVAQRLVRSLDAETKDAYQPDEHVLKQIEEELGYEVGDASLYQAVPSEKYPFGFTGRTAVVELLEPRGEIERLIHTKGTAILTEEIRKIAKEQGMKTLLQVALEKALDGETTLEEVYRVI